MLAYASGNASAFDQLYQRHKLAVYRFFIRQSLTQALAEELTHDTWLRVINARKSYQASALFRTYIFTIARRLTIDHQKRMSNQCEQTVGYELDIASSEALTNDGVMLNTTLKVAIKQQIKALPFEQREVFLLKQESGFTLDEISSITEQDKERVKSRWRYALQKMREGLSHYVK
jgi:RNA polymerase sigma-70 factor (ECF subfamily)